MKVKANAGTLSKLLQIVVRAVPAKRPTVPLLAAVLMEAKDGVLTMGATDTEISMTLGARAPIEEEGRAAIPARVLLEILRSLPREEVLLEADGKTATVSRGKNAYELVAFGNPDEFPRLPEFPAQADTDGGSGGPEAPSGGNKTRIFSVPTARLAAAVARVAACVSDDERRPVLTGVLLSFAERGAATMVATDGFRLALDEADLGGNGDAAGAAHIPRPARKEVARRCELGDEAHVALTENAAIFSVRGVVLCTRLIDGDYPDYRKLLPDSCQREFAVEAGALRDSLGRVNLIAGRQEPPAAVKLAFSRGGEDGAHTPSGVPGLSNGELTVSVRGAEAGRATETIGADVPEGESFEACFNPSSLLDGANAVEADKIRFLVDDPLKPILLSGPAQPREGDGGEKENGRAAQTGASDTPTAPVNGGQRTCEFLYMAMPVRDPAEAQAEAKAGAESETAAAG